MHEYIFQGNAISKHYLQLSLNIKFLYLAIAVKLNDCFLCVFFFCVFCCCFLVGGYKKNSPELPKIGPVLMGRLEHSKPTIFYGGPKTIVLC